MKKMFVTGGAGFIGSNLVDELLARGCSVVVYDNFSTGRRDFLPEGVRELEIVNGDLLDGLKLTEAMKGCDSVFHFQANADVRGGRTNTRIDLEQNTLTTWNVLEAMRVNSVGSVAFASSAAVYGEPVVFPTPETCAPSQTSLYGASKLAGEAMIQAYCEYFGMRCFLYRFVSWIGERYSHGIVFDLMKKLSRNDSELELLGDGMQTKSYLYVRDGVRGIMTGFEKSPEQKNVFNLGHQEHINVSRVAEIILDELQLKNVTLRYAGGKRGWVGDSPFVHLDTSKIQVFGWKPETSIEEGLRRTVRYLRRNPHLFRDRI